MRTFDANRLALDGIRKSVAHRLNVSATLVDKWCAPTPDEGGDGAKSPTDRVITMVLASRELGGKDPEAPFRCIAAALGYLPTVRMVEVEDDPASLLAGAEMMRSAADYMIALASVPPDGDAGPVESQRLEESLTRHVAVTAGQLHAIRKYRLSLFIGAKHYRKPPRRAIRLRRPEEGAEGCA